MLTRVICYSDPSPIEFDSHDAAMTFVAESNAILGFIGYWLA